MSKNSAIEWTDDTWNPVRGCSMVSAGCQNCYAADVANRFKGKGQPYEGLINPTTQGPKWSGKVMLVPDVLGAPMKWKKPRKIFVNSMSDLFHAEVPDSFIDKIFSVMAMCPQHTFQILTKRPERMRDYCKGLDHNRIAQAAMYFMFDDPDSVFDFVGHAMQYGKLKNVWLGVSVENQETANERIPFLLDTPAATRFLSSEPLLGSIDFYAASAEWFKRGHAPWQNAPILTGIDLIITGGESGPKARPMNPDWARSLRDQCKAAGVAFFHKQNGEWAPAECFERRNGIIKGATFITGEWQYWDETFPDDGVHVDGQPDVFRIGKKTAGRLLDGCEHNGFPEAK